MAEGVAKLDENDPSFRSEKPPEYQERTDMTSESLSEPDTTNSSVPNVEIRDQRFYNQHPPMAPVYSNEDVKQISENMKKEEAKKYFSLREGQFENAVDTDCKAFINPEEDGEVVSSYLLTEIDHWDHEKERIVIITEKKLILVKYNFIGLRVEDHRKIPLINCDKIQSGRFTYPKNTMMMITGYADHNPRVIQHGVRIHFQHSEPSLLQNWNPWSHEIPYISFTNHHSFDLKPNPPSHAQVKLFEKALIDEINMARSAVPNKEKLSRFEVVEEELPITVYLGLSAKVVNQSKLGFCKDRGNVFY
ncbi:tumor protein p63-regulated gene 1-like protein isoform X1 [Exaiptasia diaphana]|uniref:HSac2 domain-containing protein n=1 Tax=Exaiptasia diaphana TaxID=2652724 RepID=A0A913YT91_EXADI|nr:tumor protein p63-regulated gene 1-like protein isoform X1 [Exaiptasia diaphana]